MASDTTTRNDLTPPDAEAEQQNREHVTVPAEDTASGRTEDHTAEEVRQGHTGDHVRYILGLSIAGLVIVFAIAYFFFIN